MVGERSGPPSAIQNGWTLPRIVDRGRGEMRGIFPLASCDAQESDMEMRVLDDRYDARGRSAIYSPSVYTLSGISSSPAKDASG